MVIKLSKVLQTPSNWYRTNPKMFSNAYLTILLKHQKLEKSCFLVPWWPKFRVCLKRKGKKSILIFSTYPSILLYQSFGKWKRMSNLPPAIFIGPLNAEKRFFGSKSEKMTFPTKSHRAPLGLPGHGDGNKCCVCCLKRQHMLPKISDLVKDVLSSL